MKYLHLSYIIQIKHCPIRGLSTNLEKTHVTRTRNLHPTHKRSRARFVESNVCIHRLPLPQTSTTAHIFACLQLYSDEYQTYPNQWLRILYLSDVVALKNLPVHIELLKLAGSRRNIPQNTYFT